jgi:DNA-directed RNA polymerase subunit D
MSSSEFDVEFVPETPGGATRFVARGLTPAFANGLRRAMVADVPTLAVDTLRVMENSSVLFDEQIGLRIGLVPLETPDDFEVGESVTLALDAEGPGTAYASDLVPSDERVTAAEPDIPIIELKDGQRLECEAEAVMQSGSEHAKHQGAVAVGYRHLQRVTVEGDAGEFADDDAQIVRGVIEDDGELVAAEEFDNDLTNRYPDEDVAVERVPDAFVFHVETDGSVGVERLVTDAADELADRADALSEVVAL